MVDLLALTAELVDIPSESRHEGPITDHIEDRLRPLHGLAVERVGDNVVARTQLGRRERLVIAGHTDTVPANGNERARVDGDVLWGLGSCDMKGGVAVMLALAGALPEPTVDVTYVFYASEEISDVYNGLRHLFEHRPDLLEGDAAILTEPTGGALEAGCQGTLRLDVVLTGQRAHTARPWTGRNAIHRLGRLLAILDDYEPRQPVIDGCGYREAVQGVIVEGGVAHNVVPDRVRLVVNHRFAPDRSPDEAVAHVTELMAPVLEDGDSIEVVDAAPGAPPGLTHPLLRRLAEGHGLEVRGKLGWTDVSRFAAHGMPAVNLGPGDPLLAHTAGERVERRELDVAYAALYGLLTGAAT